MLSQLPPDAVYTAELKLKFAPALTTGRICGNGFAPPSGITKLMALSCLKMLGPTTTPMGIVAMSPVADVNTIWPLKVAAVSPWPGRFLVTTETVTVEPEFPLPGVTVNQAPPSAVLACAVQVNVPLPPLRTCTVWEAAVPPAWRKKLICPGNVSNNAELGGFMVRVTGTVSPIVCWKYWMNVISPVYVPAGRVDAFTLTVMASGVVQQPLPRLEMLNQLPPDAVYTAELKLKFAPVLEISKSCGSGLGAPWSMVKLMAFTCAKTFAPTVTLTGMVTESPAVCNTT